LIHLLLRRNARRWWCVLISAVGRIEFPGGRLRLHLRSSSRLFCRLLRWNSSRWRRVLIFAAGRIKFPSWRLLLRLSSPLLIRLLLRRRNAPGL
jgi:hypothetical protein